MDRSSGQKKSNSKPSCGKDSRIAHNGAHIGARSMSDSQGRGGNNDGVNPILRAETLATLKAGKIARNGAGTADGSGGITAATATAAVNTITTITVPLTIV